MLVTVRELWGTTKFEVSSSCSPHKSSVCSMNTLHFQTRPKKVDLVCQAGCMWLVSWCHLCRISYQPTLAISLITDVIHKYCTPTDLIYITYHIYIYIYMMLLWVLSPFFCCLQKLDMFSTTPGTSYHWSSSSATSQSWGQWCGAHLRWTHGARHSAGMLKKMAWRWHG